LLGIKVPRNPTRSGWPRGRRASGGTLEGLGVDAVGDDAHPRRVEAGAGEGRHRARRRRDQGGGAAQRRDRRLVVSGDGGHWLAAEQAAEALLQAVGAAHRFDGGANLAAVMPHLAARAQHPVVVQRHRGRHTGVGQLMQHPDRQAGEVMGVGHVDGIERRAVCGERAVEEFAAIQIGERADVAVVVDHAREPERRTLFLAQFALGAVAARATVDADAMAGRDQRVRQAVHVLLDSTDALRREAMGHEQDVQRARHSSSGRVVHVQQSVARLWIALCRRLATFRRQRSVSFGWACTQRRSPIVNGQAGASAPAISALSFHTPGGALWTGFASRAGASSAA
jgi:hypothetical protein